MKRRTFIKAISAFLAAPLVFFGAKRVVQPPVCNYLTDTNQWFLKEPFDKGFIWYVDSSKKKTGNGLSPETAFNNYNEAIAMCKSGRNDTIHLYLANG